MYCDILGNCFDVKLTTAQYGFESSWSLGTCSSSQSYSSDEEYVEQCCLDVGVYTLKCLDQFGDGWHGGFIEIQATQYCEDFSSGNDKSIQVTIGKYRFSQK